MGEYLNAACCYADNDRVRWVPRDLVKGGREPRCSGRFRLLGLLLVCACHSVALGADDDFTQDASREQRLVHRFDFNERDEGNLEPVPKFWTRFGGESFPRYASGAFDDLVGHDAPPSFGLQSEGRNVAYRYAGDATRVAALSDYMVVGWVRSDNLVDARASLSAYFLDQNHVPVASTQRFSALVGGDVDDTSWHRVEIFLPDVPPEAKTIGLTAWVVQADVWDVSPKPRRHIERRDVRAGAWFDDIQVYRLPHVDLRTPFASNVFTTGQEATLSVSVTDAEVGALAATLEILDIGGETVFRTDVPVHNVESPPPTSIDLSHLGTGLFRARVQVRTRNETLADGTLSFAKVGTTFRERLGGARAFGVVLDAEDRAERSTELALLRMLGVGAVKIPVWSGLAGVPDLTESAETDDALLYELLKSRIAVTGVFAGPPSQLVRRAGAYPRHLLGVLADEPAAWVKHLERVVAPYSSIFRSWQIGADGDPFLPGDPRLPGVLQTVRAEMRRLTTAPHLTVPGSLSRAPGDEPLFADDICLTVDDAILPRYIASHLKDYTSRGLPVSSVYVEPAPFDRTDAKSRLRDWCKRLLHLRLAGVETVMVPQPWHTSGGSGRTVTEPTAEFVVLHTLDVISDGVPGEPMNVAPGVTALPFHKGERTVLALWDDHAGPEGRVHTLQLGAADRQVDMLGRVTMLTRADDGRQQVRLTREPTFVIGADRWLVLFRTMMSLTPEQVEFKIDAHRHEFTLVNSLNVPLGGSIRIVPHEGWDISPSYFKFAVAPGGTFTKTLTLIFGRGELAGFKTFEFRVDLESDEQYKLIVPLTLSLGIEELGAWGYAIMDHDRLIVRHGITNRSNGVLSFRSAAIAPGRLLQRRPLSDLQPGQTATLEYRFRDPDELRGRTIRLLLRELNGPRLHNIEVLVP